MRNFVHYSLENNSSKRKRWCIEGGGEVEKKEKRMKSDKRSEKGEEE